MSAQWVASLSLTQFSIVALLLTFLSAPMTYGLRLSLKAAAVWYCLQGIDQIVAGNFFSNALVEYILLGAYWAAILLFIRHEGRTQG